MRWPEGVDRTVATRSKPANLDILSARSASSVLADCVGPRPLWPIAPSLIATTESAEKDVVVELGVPGPASFGVVGSEGGGGTVRRLATALHSVNSLPTID